MNKNFNLNALLHSNARSKKTTCEGRQEAASWEKTAHERTGFRGRPQEQGFKTTATCVGMSSDQPLSVEMSRRPEPGFGQKDV